MKCRISAPRGGDLCGSSKALMKEPVNSGLANSQRGRSPGKLERMGNGKGQQIPTYCAYNREPTECLAEEWNAHILMGSFKGSGKDTIVSKMECM
jgi:hypothetical protein